MVLEFVSLAIGGFGAGLAGRTAFDLYRYRSHEHPQRGFYDLMGDLWESATGKPYFGVPPAWVPRIQDLSPNEVIGHLAFHGLPPFHTAEEAKALLIEHQEIHDLDGSDHRHP